MTPLAGLLTQNEASTLSGASISAVQKAVEQGVVQRRRKNGRSLVAPAETVALALFKDLPLAVPVRTKKAIRDWVIVLTAAQMQHFELSPVTWVVFTEGLAKVRARADRYVRLREQYIVQDPGIMGGAPVIRGTRVPVRTLAALVEGGEHRDVLLEDYPNVPAEAHEIATLWTRANPPRGRPRA